MEDRYIATINESEKLWSEEYDPKAKDENCFKIPLYKQREIWYNIIRIASARSSGIRGRNSRFSPTDYCAKRKFILKGE